MPKICSHGSVRGGIRCRCGDFNVRVSGADHLDTFPSATGGIARLAYARAEREGIDVRLLLTKAGLTRQQIDDRGTRLSVKSQIRFLELAALALQDEFLGFHLAQKFDLREVGLLYYVLASSDTLGEALRRGVRYSQVANEGIVQHLCDGNDIRICLDYVGVARQSDRHQIEFWIATLIRVCRQLTGRQLQARRVSFTHRRSGDNPELKAFFGSNVKFGAPLDELAFSSSIQKMPLVGADPYLNNLLIKYCEEALAARPTNRNPFGVSVENAIALLLPHGKPRAVDVARKVGVSQRTLARRLSLEGLTFAGVLQSVRSDLADRHLRDKTLQISKVAWLLGYQDVSAFTNAFKRWTGKTPRAVRGGLQ